MTKRTGKIEYTDRAFRQDTEDAMKGDVIRALVELITNADDAYNAKGGSIRIELKKFSHPYQVLISVHDKATGLNADELEKAFARLGDVNQKFVSNVGTRGLFGRGAKDVSALGKVKFAAVKSGNFSVLEIDPSLGMQYSLEPIDELAKPAHYERCRLSQGENGLTAELFVSHAYKIPNAVDMIEKLQNHVQLRDLINRNEVYYFDERSNSEVRLKGLVPLGTPVFSEAISIPLFKLPIKLEIFQLSQKSIGALSPFSRHGLVISGKGAAYENSFLALSNRPEAGWFCGRLDAPEIHDLAREHEMSLEKTELNNTSIINRQRDGLAKNHPYFRALSAEVEKVLKPLFDSASEREGGQLREGEKLRKKLAAVSQSLASTLQQILDESDAGDLPSASAPIEMNFEGLQFIPPRKLLKVGEAVSLTLRAPLDLQTPRLAITHENGTGKISIEHNELVWQSHPRLPIKQTVVRLVADKMGTASVSAATPELQAKAELIVLEMQPKIEEEPDGLEFAIDKARVSPTKARNLILRAPLEFVGETVQLTTIGVELKHESSTKFLISPNGICAEAIVRVVAGDELGICSLTAVTESLLAKCQVEVVEGGHGKIPRISIQIIGSENPPRRVDTLPEAGQLVIKIYGRHKSLSKIFGKPTDLGFESDTSVAAQVTIGEIVALQLSIYAVERDSEKHPERYPDSSSIFFRQQEFLPKFILSLQAGLLEIL